MARFGTCLTSPCRRTGAPALQTDCLNRGKKSGRALQDLGASPRWAPWLSFLWVMNELLSRVAFTFVFAMFAAHSGSRVQTTLQRWSRRTCPDPCGTVFQGSFSVFSTLVHVLVSFYIHSIQIRMAHWHFTTLVFHVPGASAYLCRCALRPPRPLPLDSSAFRRRLAVKVQHRYSSIL